MLNRPVLMLIRQDPPERPKSHNFSAADADGGSGGRADDAVMQQAWHATGQECPEGTVAIRRTTEKDLVRASSIGRYGRRKPMRRGVRRDSTSNGHEVGLSIFSNHHYSRTSKKTILKIPQLKLIVVI
jgi:hypothetical protein